MGHSAPKLEFIDENLWTVEQQIRLIAGVWLPVRSAIVRLSDGGLVILSPIPRLSELADQIRGLGPVRALVSQTLYHHLGLVGANRAFPDAAIYGPPSIARKRPELTFTGALGDAPEPLWAQELDQLSIQGLRNLEELAFFHRPTRTLLIGDLTFNVPRPASPISRFVLSRTDSWGHFGPSKLVKQTFRDRAAVRGSVDRMLAWGPQRVVMSHGEPVESDAAVRLDQAFAFLRG